MVKWLKENQNKIVLVTGLLLVAATAFASGILFSQGEKKEPLVLSESPSSEPLVLSFDKQEGTAIFGQTNPEATIKAGEEIIESDQEGNFQLDLEQGQGITVYDEDNVIELDPGVLQSPFLNVAGTTDFPLDSSVAPESMAPQPEVKPEETSEVVPQEGEFLGSKKSDKYHLPDCRWAEKIKPENKIWFESREDAESRGYEPCSTCLK